MDVAITGAAGEVGRLAVEALAHHDLHLLTHREHEDLESETLDVTDADRFVERVAGADALVHLAWAGADEEGWNEDHAANVAGTANALAAARANGIDRVVLASSVHVAGMYNREDVTAMESLASDPTTPVDAADRPRPDSFYGVAKVTCEGLASYYADRHGLEVVALRIGWVMPVEELRDHADSTDARDRFARATWLSPRDCRHGIARSVEASLADSPVVAFLTSRNGDRFTSLVEPMVALDYRPRDDAAEVLAETE